MISCTEIPAWTIIIIGILILIPSAYKLNWTFKNILKTSNVDIILYVISFFGVLIGIVICIIGVGLYIEIFINSLPCITVVP